MKTTIKNRNLRTLTSYIMAAVVMVFSYTATSQTSHSVIINSVNNSFTPSSLTINIGDTVVWSNDGGFHNVNGDLSTFSSNPDGTIFSGSANNSWSVYEWVCTTAGSYDYQCDPHAGMGMVGTIIANLTPTNSIYDIVSNSNDHTTLKVAIDSCALDVVLSDPGSLTLFAPTDAAFNLLQAGTVTALLNDIPQLTDILKHHVVGASVMSGMLSNNQVVTTLLGTDVTVTINANGVFIDNAQVTVADIVADNGVVHVIDAVLLPTTTSVSELNHLDKEYSYSINILGEKINRNLRNQIIFDVYIDGSITKRYVR